MEFIYHGEVNVHQRNLSSFLKTAEVLRVSGLTQQAEDRDEVSEELKNLLKMNNWRNSMITSLIPQVFVIISLVKSSPSQIWIK